MKFCKLPQFSESMSNVCDYTGPPMLYINVYISVIYTYVSLLLRLLPVSVSGHTYAFIFLCGHTNRWLNCSPPALTFQLLLEECFWTTVYILQ